MNILNVADALARWTADPAVEVGPATLNEARLAVVDVLACAIAGHADVAVTASRKASRMLGPGETSALGSTDRFAAPWAAMVGGAAAHSLDYDDTGATSIAHVSAVAVPALLALAEQEGMQTTDLLEAYAIGFEVTTRVGRLLNPDHYEEGWHATATVGLVGAAASCARLLRLDHRQTLSAMSIATNFAAGSRRQIGSTMKAVQAGIGAKNALLSARLAQAGVVASADPFNGKGGWTSLVSGEARDNRGPRALQGLGEGFALDGFELMQKFYPCCASAHKTLEALGSLMNSHQFTAQDVERVETWLGPTQRNNLRFHRPVDPAQARFSLHYCASRLLLNGALTLADFWPDRVGSKDYSDLVARIHILDYEEPPKSADVDPASLLTAPLRTRVTLKSGQAWEAMVSTPKGCHTNPMTAMDRARKFRDCCDYANVEVDAATAQRKVEGYLNGAPAAELTAYLASLLPN